MVVECAGVGATLDKQIVHVCIYLICCFSGLKKFAGKAKNLCRNLARMSHALNNFRAFDKGLVPVVDDSSIGVGRSRDGVGH